MPRGRPPKPIEQHLKDGTFRKSRHGEVPSKKAQRGAAKSKAELYAFRWRCVNSGIPSTYKGADRLLLEEMGLLRRRYMKLLKTGKEKDEQRALRLKAQFEKLAATFDMLGPPPAVEAETVEEKADESDSIRFFGVG